MDSPSLRSEKVVDEVSDELIAHQYKPSSEDRDIRRVGAFRETRRQAPVTHGDENGAECEKLDQFDPNVERDEVRPKSLRRYLIVEDLRRQAEAVKKAEDQRGCSRIGLESEPRLERTEVVQRLVSDRQANNGIDQEGARTHAGQHTGDKRERVPDREEGHIQSHVAQLVQEEDHAQQEQQVIVACDQVSGAK